MTNRKTDSGNSTETAGTTGKYLYSDIPEIEFRVLSVLPAVLKSGYLLEDFKPLPYGVRLVFRKDDAAICANLYYSKKKGHSTVFDARSPKPHENGLRELLTTQPKGDPVSPVSAEQRLNCWIGSDEGGKGAYTGPLVVAAYFCDRQNAAELLESGITDSKSLAGARLIKLADWLINRFRNRIAVLELKPETYNRLYADFKEQGRSLNHLLAWAHGKTVEKLMFLNPEAVIVDQFAFPAVIQRRMPDIPNLIIRPKAENNIAVAAASVIASACYLKALKQLTDELGVTIRPGAGADADRSVREAIAKHGPDILNRLVKQHFKNTQKVMDH